MPLRRGGDVGGRAAAVPKTDFLDGRYEDVVAIAKIVEQPGRAAAGSTDAEMDGMFSLRQPLSDK